MPLIGSCQDYPCCSEADCVFWGGGWGVKLTNDKTGRANHGSGPLIRHCTDMSSSYSPMMHLPGCFLLTRLFQGHPFYRAAWCRSKVFQVSPLPPPTFTIRLLCTAGTLLLFFSFLWSKGEIAVCFKEQKLHLSVVPAISLGTSRKERWATPLSCVHNFVLIACEKIPRTWLSTSQMLTGHFPSHSDSFFIAHSPTSGNEDCTTARWCVS